MDTKGAKKRERIDLGLEAILSRAQTPPSGEISNDLKPPQRTNGSSPWTLGDTPPSTPPSKSEFESLADECKWAEIVRLADDRLGHGVDLEAQLWWIRGHLGEFTMPVSFLTAPFDALCRKLSAESVTDSLQLLLEETGLLVLQRLREVGDAARADEVRATLERLGVKELRGGRERTKTSSFRSLESVVPVTIEGAHPQEPPIRVSRGAPKRIVWTLLCLVLFIALMVLDQIFPHIRTPALALATESFEEPRLTIEQAMETAQRRDPGGRLGALFYSIGEGAAANPAPTDSIASRRGGAPQSLPETPIASNEPLPSRSKDEVNTSGPIEGPEFRERVEEVRPQSFGGRREELQGGSPQAVIPGSSPQGFEGQKTYRVLTPTSVLSAPSYGGRAIGQLERGDRVLVEGKLGRWLRLRSKKGRGGYVLATDVEEVPELDEVPRG